MRNAPLGDVEPSHDLQARGDLHRERDRRTRDLRQHAVLAQANSEVLLVRLEVDVGRAFLDGVDHDLVDEPDDRRVVDVGARDVGAAASSSPPLTSRFSRSKPSSVVEVRHRRVDCLDGASDAGFELVLLDDDGFDAQRRLELDLVERLQVGRVADGDEQALAALQDRQDPVLQQQLLVDELDDVEIEVDGVEIEQRNAELVGGRDRDLPRIAEAIRHEVRHEVARSCRRSRSSAAMRSASETTPSCTSRRGRPDRGPWVAVTAMELLGGKSLVAL